MWQLEDAINLIRSLKEPIQSFGYHIALSGEIFNDEESESLDLIFIPLHERADTKGLRYWLSSTWGWEEPIRYPKYDTRYFDTHSITTLESRPQSIFKHELTYLREAGDRIKVYIV